VSAEAAQSGGVPGVSSSRTASAASVTTDARIASEPVRAQPASVSSDGGSPEPDARQQRVSEDSRAGTPVGAASTESATSPAAARASQPEAAPTAPPEAQALRAGLSSASAQRAGTAAKPVTAATPPTPELRAAAPQPRGSAPALAGQPVPGSSHSAPDTGASAGDGLPGDGGAGARGDGSAAAPRAQAAAAAAQEGQGAATLDAPSEATAAAAPEQSTFGPSPSSAAPLLGAGVGMQEMIDAIRASVELSRRGGISQARIALSPEELGELRIHVSQSTAGLVVRVTADTAAAAQALSQGRTELAHALGSLGLHVLEVNSGASGGAQTGEHRQGAFATGERSAQKSDAPTQTEEDATQAPSGEADQEPVGVPADGALVNVLA
jgi:flagellar hook-length control protein FliK